MTVEEFNNKYYDYIEYGFNGLLIHNQSVIDYLDLEFENEISVKPDFVFSLIKVQYKWNMSFSVEDVYINL